MQETYPDFKGKCLSILTQDDTANHDLFNPHFENQAGRIFIVGTVPKDSTESNWNTGNIVSVAWDRVAEYYTFEDLETYYKATKISEEFHKDDEEEK